MHTDTRYVVGGKSMDKGAVRELDIRTWVKQLRHSLGNPRPQVDLIPLRKAHGEKTYGDLVRLIRDAMRLEDVSVRVGYVNAGGNADAVAWVKRPHPLPQFGSSAFRQLQIELYIRKSLLEQDGFEVSVMGIAHEFSHIILDAIPHPLRTVEEAVDLTAMLLGFRDLFETTHAVEEASIQDIETLLIDPSFDLRTSRIFGVRYGYLSIAERKFAATLMR